MLDTVEMREQIATVVFLNTLNSLSGSIQSLGLEDDNSSVFNLLVRERICSFLSRFELLCSSTMSQKNQEKNVFGVSFSSELLLG